MRIAALSLFALCALLVCAAGAQRALAAPTPSPAPTMGLLSVPEDTTVTKVARAELDAWKANNVDLSYYAPAAAGYYTADMKQKASAFLTSLGAITSFTYIGKATYGDKWAYDYAITGANGKGQELIHVGSDGKIDFIAFLSA